ncbi:MAG: hypothetical protein UY96_C0015G0015 [Parcubacteria group bacterium GW2011_GWB1_56_8]|nr:MAG: hypothetical protein UY96_C0015G0015 [Parcubacteria group bacterium GW2011_GWB1_56_8]
MIVPVQRDRALDVWRDAEPFVTKALEQAQGEFDSLDILRFVLSRDMQLWLSVNQVISGVAVTQIIHYPRIGGCCRVVLLSGDGALGAGGWFDEMMDAIEGWAKQNGLKRVEESGREGWIKTGKHRGYRKAYITLVKDL